ncbi:MAG: phospholipase D-like domain-containing protein [Elusimicrobiales bacterium]|nr:phospholipase D-like domain-containing protein [Elusimicrobiales bacterium]
MFSSRLKISLFTLAACAGFTAASAQAPIPAADTAWIAQSVPEETVYGSKDALDAQKTWIEMIDSAVKSLEMGEFYFENKKGEALGPVLDSIRAAAARGVRVRIIADGVFYRKMPATINSLRQVKNIRVRIIDFGRLGGGVMHAKYFIVDGTDAYVGSQNMDWRSLSQIHEIGVRMKSARLAEAFRRVFYSDWAAAAASDIKGKDEPAPKFAAQPVTAKSPQALTLGGERISAYPAFGPKGMAPGNCAAEIDELIRLINSAQSEIRAQVMYYSLERRKGGEWRELDNALRGAAKRGVSVKLIFADWDMKGKKADAARALARVPNIAVRISSIPPSSRGPIEFARVEHCKYMTVDGRTAVISTSNWEYDYFYASRDAAMILTGKKPAAILNGIFNAAWTGPYAAPVSQTGGQKKSLAED